ncbi:MAG: hypothetical protein WBG24_02285 [Syntrophobacteria bacterium]
MEKLSDEVTDDLSRAVAEAEALHKLWHELRELLEQHGRDLNNLTGWEDIQLMDDFCKDHPEIIKVQVDDSHHCHSYVYIIPHERDDYYMGSTALFIPQCGNHTNQFFLFPKNHRQMISALRELERKSQEKRYHD